MGTQTAIAAKERPILFSAPMVKAILAGKKTQTRRAVKPQPNLKPGFALEMPGPMSTRAIPVCWDCKAHGVPNDSPYPQMWLTEESIHCPYGVPGDRLWVRETWRRGIVNNGSGHGCIVYRADGKSRYMICEEGGEGDFVKLGGPSKAWEPDGVHWKPSIFMPRAACRIMLEITNVRCERLHTITEADAVREGAQCAGVPASLTNRVAFAKLWQAINGKPSWDANPWVWVMAFKRLDQPANAI